MTESVRSKMYPSLKCNYRLPSGVLEASLESVWGSSVTDGAASVGAWVCSGDASGRDSEAVAAGVVCEENWTRFTTFYWFYYNFCSYPNKLISQQKQRLNGHYDQNWATRHHSANMQVDTVMILVTDKSSI